MITMLLFTLGGISCGATIAIFRLMSDVRLWRDDARDMRSLYRGEQRQRRFLEQKLEDMQKDPHDGVYR